MCFDCNCRCRHCCCNPCCCCRGERGATGVQGTPGTNGTNGTDGIAATITIGTTTTVAPNTPATVVNVGTSNAAILDFGIPQGIAGSGISGFADFFALMPGDNAATVAVGSDVDFPQDGSISGTSITRLTANSFNLANIGTYQISFQVSVTEAGQLILTLNGADLAYTVAGRATGTSQIQNTVLVTTSVINSVLTVRNPTGNSTALTITPLAGGTRSVSAHLTIMQIA